MFELESFLKLTRSMQITLIPASESYIEKKDLTWTLLEVRDDQLVIQLNFTHPHFISSDGPDSLEVLFNKAGNFFRPESKQLKNIPDGYSLLVEIPPQGGDEALSDQEIQEKA